MADLSINAAAVSASNQATIRREYPFGAAIGAGQVVYLDANNRWQLMDANASVAGNNITDTRGIALCNGANGQPASVCVEDPDFTPGATVANGVSYYASPNAGAIAAAGDITTGNYATFLMVGKSTSKVNLRPVAAGVAV